MAPDHVRALLEATEAEQVIVPRRWLEALLSQVGALAPSEGRPAAVQMLNVREAAKLTGMSTAWLYHNQADIPGATRVGVRSVRFDARQLERWLVARGR